MKVAQANEAVVAARKALAAQAAAGNDPRRDPEVNRKRAKAISDAHRRNREWKRGHAGDEGDETWFKREIMPRLDGFALKDLAAATGLSLVACSRIRAGTRVPHPRHWHALTALVNGMRPSWLEKAGKL
jgi:hypothetical protein